MSDPPTSQKGPTEGPPPIEATLFLRQNRPGEFPNVWTGPTPDWQYELDDIGSPAFVSFQAKSVDATSAEGFLAGAIEFLDANKSAFQSAITQGWDPHVTFVVSVENVKPGHSMTVVSNKTASDVSRWGLSVGFYFD